MDTILYHLSRLHSPTNLHILPRKKERQTPPLQHPTVWNLASTLLSVRKYLFPAHI